MKDCFIACVDGLTGLPEATRAVFPQTRVQLCMVHLVRNSLKYVSYKQRKAVATDLKAIYAAATEAEAEFNLELKALEMGPAVSHQKPHPGGRSGRASSHCSPSQRIFGIRDLHHQRHPVRQHDGAVRSRAITASFRAA